MVPALLENSQLIFEEEELEGNPVFVILGDYTAGESGPVGLVLNVSYRVLDMVKGAVTHAVAQSLIGEISVSP